MRSAIAIGLAICGLSVGNAIVSPRVAVVAAVDDACPGSFFPASGQTTSYTADTQDTAAAPVPDDGTEQNGKTLHYRDNGDGTITDLNTRLMWEKKVAGVGCLHCSADHYPWSTLGGTTIWDWLDAINAEGGQGFAGHNDWRIPNVRELHSIVDFELIEPAINPIFGPTHTYLYWSSTTSVAEPARTTAWTVNFRTGAVEHYFKNHVHTVRAVRGGCRATTD